jgi:hypothetical protein
MDSAKGQLVFDLAQGRISEEEFVSRSGTDPRTSPDVVRNELEQAVAEKSADRVECAIILGFHFGLSPSWAPLLCKLLEEDWHFRHEDIADALQDIRAPATVDCLYRSALKKHGYLAYNDSSALAIKCIWALHDIGTADAIEKLKLLAETPQEAIRHNARERLAALAARSPEDPAPMYRRARDRRLRSDGG